MGCKSESSSMPSLLMIFWRGGNRCRGSLVPSAAKAAVCLLCLRPIDVGEQLLRSLLVTHTGQRTARPHRSLWTICHRNSAVGVHGGHRRQWRGQPDQRRTRHTLRAVRWHGDAAALHCAGSRRSTWPDRLR